MTRPDPQAIEWQVLDKLNDYKQVATLVATDRPSAERAAQRLGFSLKTHKVQGVLEFSALRNLKSERR